MKNHKAKTQWIMIEDNPDMDFGFARIWCAGSVYNFKKHTQGKSYKEMLVVYRPYHGWFYYGDQDAREVGNYLANMIVKNPAFATRTNKQIVVVADKLRRFSEKLPQEHLEQYSSSQLWEWFSRHQILHTEYYEWGWIPVAADMFDNSLTDKVKQYLRSIDVPENKISEYMMVLTQPIRRSLIQEEQQSLLAIVAAIQKNKNLAASLKKKFNSSVLPLKISRAFAEHYRHYAYVQHMWVGAAADMSYYYHQVHDLLRTNIHATAAIAQEKKALVRAKRDRDALMNSLDVSPAWREILHNFGEFMVTKIYRRYAQIYAVYALESILVEIARRLGMTLYELRCMLPTEIKLGLLHGRVNRVNVKKRARLFVYHVQGTKEKIYTGAQARSLVKSVETLVEDVHELHGQVGCVGAARGKVKVVITPSDMKKMNKGDILVSIATNPDIVAAMKKAAAIITEQGGVTSHAAIVARELGIPCVIGTKIATRVLKDGDRVMVDAYKGLVRKI